MTGGSRGIGAAIVRKAVRRGYAVCFSYLKDDEAAGRLRAELESGGARAAALRGGVADPDFAPALFDHAERTLGTVTALVNNAGTTGRIGPFVDADAATLRRVLEVNVLGVMYCAQEAVRRWGRDRIAGRMVNVASIASALGAPNEYVHYAGAKAAVEAFSVGLAKELAPTGTRVNAVAPGTVYTGIHAAAGEPGRPARVVSRVPLGRIGEASEIANAVLWLLDDEASYVTGAVLRVSGRPLTGVSRASRWLSPESAQLRSWPRYVVAAPSRAPSGLVAATDRFARHCRPRRVSIRVMHAAPCEPHATAVRSVALALSGLLSTPSPSLPNRRKRGENGTSPERIYLRRGAKVITTRLEARNALSSALVEEMAGSLDELERDENVRVVLLTGAGRDFAVGADIREMVCMNVQDVSAGDFAGCCTRLGEFRKPVVAAVAGYALGGGCELVEMCDVVIASENARFGHPEVSLGTMSGAGGTQRLPRLVRRHVALDVLLTGRMLSAAEALMFGLVSRVVPREALMNEAEGAARRIASFPADVVRSIKESVARSDNMPLADDLALERRMFHLTLASNERRARMEAFVVRSKHA